jgi:hypothetical protein
MKVKTVSALRSKRGLHRANGAEPPIEAVPQLTDTNPNNQEQLSNLERKTDTMKTYILRQPKPVELQKSSRPPRPKPATATVAKGPFLFIGLDARAPPVCVGRGRTPAI